jgi:hypothetical protein
VTLTGELGWLEISELLVALWICFEVALALRPRLGHVVDDRLEPGRDRGD